MMVSDKPVSSSQRVGYRPSKVQMSPLFTLPPQASVVLKWIFGFPGYLFPWNVIMVGIAVCCWCCLEPSMEKLKDLSPSWIATTLIRNLVLLLTFAGTWHLHLYTRKRQGIEFKYSPRWLATDDAAFLFKNQLWDNIFWSLGSAVPIWTIYETLTIWLQVNKLVPTVSLQSHPIYCLLLSLVIPMWIQVHFYAAHRLIHWKPLYSCVHYIHHKNVNFGPWSGLAMHPIEHFLLFSAVALFWVIPAHPLHAMQVLIYLGLSPALSHSGFDRLVFTASKSLDVGEYMHYLHHKYVKVNYGGDAVPLDKWFGTLHDGSEEAEAALKTRTKRAG